MKLPSCHLEHEIKICEMIDELGWVIHLTRNFKQN